METVTLATSQADADAVEAVRNHHASLSGALALRVSSLVQAAVRQDVDSATRARADLVDWLNLELVPHAVAEEETIYEVGGHIDALQPLVRAMFDEHATLVGLVTTLEDTEEMVRCAAVATAIHELFDSHRRKEEDYLLPTLASNPEVSVAHLLDGMHDLLGGHDRPPHDAHDDAPGDHDCACGEVDEGDPELDVRDVPHAIRHATVFGALSAIKPGGALVLVAPHDPLPLLAQAEQLYPDLFTVGYLQRGPDAWHLRFARTA